MSVVAFADADYTKRKFENGKPRVESYVVMQGRYFDGATRDPGIEKMPFRRIIEYLAPELARQQFLPAKSLGDADLLVIVHWGTTWAHVGDAQLTGRPSPVTDTSNSTLTMTRQAMLQNATGTGMQAFVEAGNDQDRQMRADRLEQLTEQMSGDLAQASNVALLGYGRDLSRLSKDIWGSEEEKMLRYDLATERYFIILKAYDLHAHASAGRRKPVWTLHLNISSPGNSFRSSVKLMGAAAVNFIGRSTESVTLVRPAPPREGKVEIGEPMIIRDEK